MTSGTVHDPDVHDAATVPLETDVSELVALCLERLSLGSDDALEHLCREHPRCADELRRRVERLGRRGLLGGRPDAAPARIGPFRVLGLLGRGGMGCVWLGQQLEPVRRLVAVKVLPGGAASDHQLQRFRTEQQALAQLRHPGIAAVLEAGTTDDGQPWFAMEYVEGRPLVEVADAGTYDLRARLELFLQVCDAVTYAHQNGILHRDLKPSNVLVTEVLGRPLVKVIDFGLAKTLDPAEAPADVTYAGQVMGTPAYMSPEQAGVAGQRVDLRTDVYALGVILYQLVTGRLPLEPRPDRPGGLAAMQELLRDVEPTPPSRRVRGLATSDAQRHGQADAARWSRALAGDIDWIAARALAKDRDERYAAVSELAADVRRHLSDQPVLAGPPSAVYRVSRLLRRHRREAAVGALGLLGLLVTLVVIAVQAGRLGRELLNFDTLSYELELADAVGEARDELWPERPERVPAMRAWRTRLDALLAERPRLRALRDGLERGSPLVDGARRFASPRDGYLFEHVGALVAGLDALAAPGGLRDEVERRIAWGEGLAELTVGSRRAAWDEAIASIADPARCPAYGGLRIAPQVGFVPLGRDPVSGLWEFAFPRPGEAFPRGVPGCWTVGEDTCLVFVLVPGGTLLQGLQDEDPRMPGYLAEPARWERWGGRVALDPFFLSKYEVTQGQWLRIAGENPSYYAPGHPRVAGLQHPVERVSWFAAERVLGHLGLALPTGAQWEYAARGGLPWPWWTGPEGRPVACVGNTADLACLRAMGRGGEISTFDEDYDDGYPAHAPVGSFLPNPFGLHDVIGNVWEWCADPGVDYDEARPRAGDGLARPVVGSSSALNYELRGGSYYSPFTKCRATMRLFQAREGANMVFGVRPARALEPSSPPGDRP